MKRIIYIMSFVVILFSVLQPPNVNANDIYVPFEKKENKNLSSNDIINFTDPNLKQALLEYYKFHIDKKYTGQDLTVSMLEKFTSLTLSWSNIFSLDGLEYAVNLKNLNLANNFIEDTTPLKNLINLKTLDLSHNKIKELDSLSNLKKITELSVKKNLISKLDFLSDMNLEKLDLSYNSSVKSEIKKIKLNNLSSLNISNMEINNIDFIKDLEKLEILIAEGNKIVDINAVKNLKNLRILYLDKNNIENINALENLENLEEVLLYKNNITNIESLKNKEKLYRLMLNDNQGLENIDILKTLKNLSSLDISNTKVIDISSLSELKNLYYVAIKDTKLNKDNIENFEKANTQIKKQNNIDKKLEIINNDAKKYFSLKNYIFMTILSLLVLSGIISYFRKN